MKNNQLLIFLVCSFLSLFSSEYKIAIIGAGHVGLVTGTCLASFGNKIIFVDKDTERIECLKRGILPIYEPSLDDYYKEASFKGLLSFTTDLPVACREAQIIIVCVNTPFSSSGSVDISMVENVSTKIALALDNCGDDFYKVICFKSTVPVGTCRAMQKVICKNEKLQKNVDVVFNPEFLREGSALKDFMTKNPIIVGSSSERARKVILSMYGPLVEKNLPVVLMDLLSAELTKYAWNIFSSLRVSYVNELSRFCDKTGANIFDVIKGMSYSTRLLPTEDLKPGPGLAGPCLLKDIKGLVGMDKCLDLILVRAILESNKKHVDDIKRKILLLSDNALCGKTISIFGLSFKANTDDITGSIAIELIGWLLGEGAHVKVYDPVAMQHIKKLFPSAVLAGSAYDAVRDAHVLIIATEWKEFKRLNLEEILHEMKERNILDLRNVFPLDALRRNKCRSFNLGVN